MQREHLTFCTIFPNYKDFHFYKDPGQIPFRFSGLGYHTSLVCYGKKQKLPVTEKHLKVIKVADNYFSRRFNAGIILHLLLNSGKMDILNTFHLTWSSLFFTFLYKSINRSGFTYIKLDTCAIDGINQWEKDYSDIESNKSSSRTLKGKIKSWIARKYFIRRVDLFSIEDDHSKDLFEAKYAFMKGKLITVYNGHTSDLPGSSGTCRLEDKEDIILTAGRLGTYQKATETILDAFSKIAPVTKYNLHLAGTVEPEFQDQIVKYLGPGKDLNDRVIFHGPLKRDELYRLYSRAKIFCLPSRHEGMAIVFPEAMFYKDVIVTTNSGSLKPLIDKFHFGLIINKDNPEELAEALLKLIKDDDLMQQMARNAYDTALTLLSWGNIIEVLRSEIQARIIR